MAKKTGKGSSNKAPSATNQEPKTDPKPPAPKTSEVVFEKKETKTLVIEDDSKKRAIFIKEKGERKSLVILRFAKQLYVKMSDEQRKEVAEASLNAVISSFNKQGWK